MRHNKSITLVLVIVLLNTAPSWAEYIYPAAKHLVPKATKKLPMKVAFIKFADLRPAKEQTFKARENHAPEGKPLRYTRYGKNKDYLSKGIYLHLKWSKLFKDVKYKKNYENEDILENGIPEKLKKNFDAIMIGEIEHIWGYSDRNSNADSALSMTGGMIGGALVGAVGGAVIGAVTADDGTKKKKGIDYHNKGEMIITNIKLIDTETGIILWQGEINESIDERGSSPYPLDRDRVVMKLAEIALPKLVNELEKIELNTQ